MASLHYQPLFQRIGDGGLSRAAESGQPNNHRTLILLLATHLTGSRNSLAGEIVMHNFLHLDVKVISAWHATFNDENMNDRPGITDRQHC